MDDGEAIAVVGRIRSDQIKENASKQVVYFIRAESGPIKIGIAIDPMARLAQIQQHNHEELELLAVEPGDRDRERYLHDRFAKIKIRGEWFYPEKPLWDHIYSLPPLPEPEVEDEWTDEDCMPARFTPPASRRHKPGP